MTDVSSVKAHADPQPANVAFFAGPPPTSYTNGSPTLDGTVDEEESSTIKCVCGYADDDGNTVLCEKCDTWQHIVCYYDSPADVPDIHDCTDCVPRAIDAKGANEKQRLRRELHNIGERKVKPKTAPKGQKRRVKDPLGSVQPNGWAVHSNSDLHYPPERKSGSPRDQPPPSKRPKTSHRASGSVGMLGQAPALVPGSRKRASSTLQNEHSPVKSPNIDGPLEEYSPEFMNLYRQPDPPPANSNSYTDIGVANDISLWLNDRDALAEATGGLQPADVFQRIDQTIEELQALAPVINKQTEEDAGIVAHGHHPQWQFLTVETHVPCHAFIGEIKGRIGRKDDYFAEPANRWDLLRHPEPFVFFPPRLPIYIDTRHEGSDLRYVRRSCNPNIEMKILTQGTETGYHFCFIAMREIEPDEELTIGWEIDPEIQQKLIEGITNGDIRKEGLKKIEPWVACVLSNFGGCACDTRRGRECLLERARRPNTVPSERVQPPKSTKGRKPKKPQISPLSTGRATNSRAGSEAFNRDAHDDENMDSRSTSGSHKSSSRDITPATHFSVDGVDLKMSDRERRKLQQQERLFEQLEYHEQHKGRKGKRNSAGSTLNTPGLLSSKQLGHSEPSPSARNPRSRSNGVGRKTSGDSSHTNGRAAPKPKPMYTDSSTQTDDDKPRTAPVAAPFSGKTAATKRPVSFKQRLLQQTREDTQQRQRSASVKKEAQSPALKEFTWNKASPTTPTAAVDRPPVTETATEPEPAAEVAPNEPVPTKETTTPEPPADSEMNDAGEAATISRPPSPKVEEMPDAPLLDASSDAAHSLIQPPPPPWPAAADTTPPETSKTLTPEAARKPVDLHVQLPPPNLVIPTASANSAVTPGSISGTAIAQSPIGLQTGPPPGSPSVANVASGPARKKVSLSDYISGRAKLAQTQSSGTSATPPLAQSQSVSSPTLSTSSLPNQTSPPGKSAEPPVLSAVNEEEQPVQATATTV